MGASRPCKRSASFLTNRSPAKYGNLFGQYAAYFDFLKYGLIDQVSKKSLTCNIPGTRYDYDDDGNVITATEDQPMIVPGRGLRGVGSYQNLCLWSEDKTKFGIVNSVIYENNVFTISSVGDNYISLHTMYFSLPNLAVGATYSAKLENLTGTGLIKFSIIRFGGTYEGWDDTIDLSLTPQKLIVPIVFEYGDHTGIYIKIEDNGSGCALSDDFKIQITESPYHLPYIPTNGSIGTSVSEAGADDYGTWADGLQSNFPALYESLNGIELEFTSSEGYIFPDGADEALILSAGTYTTNWIPVNTSSNYHLISTIANRMRIQFKSVSGVITYSDQSDNEYPYLLTTDADTAFFRVYYTSNGDEGDLSIFETLARGTLTLTWQPGYDSSDAPGEHTLLSFDGTIPNLRYDATNEQLELTDGANIATVSCTAVAGTEYEIKATWEDDEMKLWVNDTAGSIADFIGTFSPGTDINFFDDNDELNYIKDLKILKEPDWS